MPVGRLGEVRLIERMRRRIEGAPGARPATGVHVGIGDDTAVLDAPPGRQLLFASDMLIEGVHFLRRDVPARWIGWKALACNISDIAAMGGTPRWAVVSLGMPRATSAAFVDALYQGLAQCARRFRTAIVGGDTVRAPQLVVDVAVVGTVKPGRAVRRSGVRVGDALYVTGRLGGSLRSGRHARFMPRVTEAAALQRRVALHAMMDLSDGLAQDAWQMSRASRVVLRLAEAQVPVSRGAPPVTVSEALMDGEDFELLFAVGARDAARVPRRIAEVPVTRVGAAVARGVGVELERRDGRIVPLVPQGFRHW